MIGRKSVKENRRDQEVSSEISRDFRRISKKKSLVRASLALCNRQVEELASQKTVNSLCPNLEGDRIQVIVECRNKVERILQRKLL
jgi:hypothetical protein